MVLKAYYHSKRKSISENFQRYQDTIVGEKVHTVKETIYPDKRDILRPTQGHKHTHRPTQTHIHRPPQRQTDTDTCKHSHRHTYTHTQTHTDIQTHAHTHTYT